MTVVNIMIEKVYRLSKKGLAGLILTVLILGFIMAIGTSNALLVQTQATAEGAKNSYKRSFYAAMAGIHFVINQLRCNPASPWTTTGRLFFTYDGVATTSVYKQFSGSTGPVNFSGYTNLKAKEEFRSTYQFTTNTEEKAENCIFLVSTYPGADTDKDYWVKSQGTYVHPSGTIFKSQVWALLKIDNSAKTVDLVKWGSMAVQPTDSVSSTAPVNDFWDWQDEFY